MPRNGHDVNTGSGAWFLLILIHPLGASRQGLEPTRHVTGVWYTRIVASQVETRRGGCEVVLAGDKRSALLQGNREAPS